MPGSAMKGGRFETRTDLLELSPGELLSREYRQHGLGANIEVELRALDPYLLSQTAEPMFVSYDTPQLPVPRRRPTHIRDLFPQVPVTQTVAPYVMELHPDVYQFEAQQVGEAMTMPQVQLLFEGGSHPVKKTAAWVEVTDEIMDDGPGLSGYINNRLVELLYLADDYQLLRGDGTGNNQLGVFNTAEVQTSSAGTTNRQAVALAAADVEQVDANVDTVVLSPADFWPIFDAYPQWPGELADLGIGLVRTQAMPAGRALVGAFGQSGALRVRTAANLRVATQADEDFTIGRMKVLCEMREALNVSAPELLCQVTLPGTP